MAVRTYGLWRKGPWELPKPGAKTKPLADEQQTEGQPDKAEVVSARSILERNLFDPERGAAGLQETEVAARSLQRIRSFTLMGTFIVGDSRYAVITVPPEAGGGANQNMRLKLGDIVEGFQVADIQEKSVVFKKGQSSVDLTLDFLRKVEIPAPRRMVTPPTQPRPQPQPRAPRVSPSAMSQHEKMARERRGQQ